MRFRIPFLAFLLCLAAFGVARVPSHAQTKTLTNAQAAAKQQVHGTLIQVMRGILFPLSNVIFAAQTQDPAAIKRDADPNMSPNLLTGAYGGWQAIENAGIGLAEAANLLTIPGRLCSNGKPAPIQGDDWAGYVQELRDAGMATYKAAQMKDMDAIVDVSDQVTTACSHCHDVYREKPIPTRCTK